MAPNVNHDAATMLTKQRLIQHELFLSLKEEQQQQQQQQQSGKNDENKEREARQDQDSNAVISSSSSTLASLAYDPTAAAASAAVAVSRALMVHATEDSVMTALLDEQWDTLEALCRDNQSLVASQSITMVCQGENTTCLPVHFCCGRKSTPLSTINALVTAHCQGRGCLMMPESNAGRLPIHMAVLKGAASLDVVEYLCRTEPQSLCVTDHEGNLPLHYAAMYASDAVIQVLVRSYPAACHEANTQSQRWPLHLLCARSWGGYSCCDDDDDDDPQQMIVSMDTINMVIQEYPDALKQPDRRGRLPLHVHCASDPRADVLQVLVERFPEALLMTDDSNAKWTPLSLARKFTTTLDSNNNNKSGKSSTTTNGSSNVVLAYLIEMTNKERRKKYKFLAPLKAVGGKIVAARRRASKPDPEAFHLHYCYG